MLFQSLDLTLTCLGWREQGNPLRKPGSMCPSGSWFSGRMRHVLGSEVQNSPSCQLPPPWTLPCPMGWGQLLIRGLETSFALKNQRKRHTVSLQTHFQGQGLQRSGQRLPAQCNLISLCICVTCWASGTLTYKFLLQGTSLHCCCFAWFWDAGWEAGGAGEPAPAPLCQLHGNDSGEKWAGDEWGDGVRSHWSRVCWELIYCHLQLITPADLRGVF